MSTISFQVDGLTCNNCVGHVTDAFNKRDEVSDVQVELVSGGTSTVNLTLIDDISDADIAEIVEEEGYDLVSVAR